MKHPLPDEALEADIATLAQKGAGKSYTNRGLVEILLDTGRRPIIIDPLGHWWGLKVKADGSAGYPVAVIGGEHADVPLDVERGAELAEFLAKNSLPVVIDTSELKRSELNRWGVAFFETLYRTNREPLWLVLEEADVFAPQVPGPDQATLMHWIDAIARRGRARGFRLWSITQRPARLHKDILTQASSLILMRIRSPQDRSAAEEWIKGHAEKGQAAEIVGTLASLKVGEGWVWAPDQNMLERVTFPKIRTLDTSFTPKAGEKRQTIKSMAKAEISALQALLAPARPQTADSIGKATGAPAQPRDDRIPQEATSIERDGRLWILDKRAAQEAEAAYRKGANAERNVLRDELSALVERLKEKATHKAAPVTPAPKHEPEVAARTVMPGEGTGCGGPAPDAIPGPQQRILDALAWWERFGIKAPTRHQVAFIAGYTLSGTFDTYQSRMRAAGLISLPGNGTMQLTEGGRAAAVKPVGRMSIDQLHSAVMDKIGAERKLLTVLLQDYPYPITRSELARKSGYSESGTFDTYCSRLKGLDLIEIPNRGFVRASAWLFPQQARS